MKPNRSFREPSAEGTSSASAQDDADMLADLDPDGIYLCMLDAYPYMMSTCQVAEALNVTPQAIRKQLNAGQLRGTRMGSSWIVPKAQLLRYLYRNHNYTSD